MQQRVQALAAQFAEANAAIKRLVESCTEAQWQTPCVVGEWSVCVTVHHIINGYDQEGWVAALIAAILAGKALPEHPADSHPERDYNEWYTQQFATRTKDEALALLRQNEAAGLRLIEGLQDADLDKTAPASSERKPVSVQRIIEHILINHAQEHLKSLRATLEAE
ncbi:MAG TPA: DinB family protein [Ktedonobacterales bacterium]|jgi:hypothetical protein